MKELFYNEDNDVRVIIQEDENARNPRLDKDNLCILETWDIVSPSPDHGELHRLRSKLVHTLGKDANDEWRAYWTDKKGRSHTKNDEYTVTLFLRTLRAFGESPFVAMLAKGDRGRLVIADEWREGIVGIAYVMPLTAKVPEEDLREYMQEEIDKYNQWARGDVYKYVIEYVVDCPCGGAHPGCTGSSWEESTDKADGIYGKDIAIGQAALAWSEMEKSA